MTNPTVPSVCTKYGRRILCHPQTMPEMSTHTTHTKICEEERRRRKKRLISRGQKRSDTKRCFLVWVGRGCGCGYACNCVEGCDYDLPYGVEIGCFCDLRLFSFLFYPRSQRTAAPAEQHRHRVHALLRLCKDAHAHGASNDRYSRIAPKKGGRKHGDYSQPHEPKRARLLRVVVVRVVHPATEGWTDYPTNARALKQQLGGGRDYLSEVRGFCSLFITMSPSRQFGGLTYRPNNPDEVVNGPHDRFEHHTTPAHNKSS